MGDKQKKSVEKIRKCLKRDDIVIGETGAHYLVEDILGKANFGEVYKVSATKDPEKKYALKTELIKVPSGEEHLLRLKIETNFFSELAKLKKTDGPDKLQGDTSHFINMIDKGTTVNFKYYLADLVGPPLTDVVEKMLNGNLSAHAKLHIARQTLASIEALHEMKYLHRAIMRKNFAVGLAPKDNILYMMGFGIVKCYVDKHRVIRIPRKRVKFIGTAKYATIANLEEREQSRRDDLEGWVYMMIEFYNRKNIIWRNARNMRGPEVIYVRKGLFENPEQFVGVGRLKNIPDSFFRIIRLIGGMDYYAGGNFKRIRELLHDVMMEEHVDMGLQLDWIGKKMPAEPKKSVKRQAKEKPGKKGKAADKDDSDEEEEEIDRDTSEFEDFQQWRKARKEGKDKGKAQTPKPEPKKTGDQRTEQPKSTYGRVAEKEQKTATEKSIIDKTMMDVSVDADFKTNNEKSKMGEVAKKADNKPLKLGFAETVLAKK